MKTLFIFIFIFFICFNGYSQFEGRKSLTKEEASNEIDNLDNIKRKGINYGISLGFNKLFETIYDSRISPIDSTLNLQIISPISYLISTSISFPLTKGKFGGAYYRKLDSNGDPIGDPYFVPFGFSFIASINLVTFNSALSGSGVFNQKIDGGLGIAYTVNNEVQISLTYEMITFRQPRDFLIDKNGKPIIIGDSKLSSLPFDDNNFFIDKYLPSISLKLIYILNNKK